MNSAYDWVREISTDLKAIDDIPLTGNAPPFPWGELSQRLARSFEREGLQIKPENPTLRTQAELFEGLGDTLSPLIFSVPTLRGEVTWIMPEQEMAILESILLTKESHPITFQDKALSESFYHFIALEVLYNLSQMNYDKTITPLLTHRKELPKEACLCLDISLTFDKYTVWGRLIIPPAFRSSWVEHFTAHPPSAISQKLSQRIETTLHVEAGHTNMFLSEWRSVKCGDFIVLDHCTLEAGNPSSGSVNLTIRGRAAFRASLKDGNIKIVELPLIHEVEIPMAKEHDDDLDDLDLTEDDFTEDDLTDEMFEVEEEDEDLLNTPPPTPASAAKSAASTPSAAPVAPAAIPKPLASSPPTQPSQPSGEAKKLHAGHIPIILTVEIGRIEMSVDKLLKLEPGNLLELNVRPENGVSLTINGKVVGKGDLVRIGEVLGVRILELG